VTSFVTLICRTFTSDSTSSRGMYGRLVHKIGQNLFIAHGRKLFAFLGSHAIVGLTLFLGSHSSLFHPPDCTLGRGCSFGFAGTADATSPVRHDLDH
jgi:hypothetical protein